jgi:hypothetical protein
MAIERESLWLRPRVIQMRAMLRYVKNQAVEAALREFITDAEARLERPITYRIFRTFRIGGSF